MMRIVTAAILAGFVPGCCHGRSVRAGANGAIGRCGSRRRRSLSTDASAQRRPAAAGACRSTGRTWEPDVYPRYNPGPNAVRDCTATYVQEYRPSGTVITPRMNCYWRPG